MKTRSSANPVPLSTSTAAIISADEIARFLQRAIPLVRSDDFVDLLEQLSNIEAPARSRLSEPEAQIVRDDECPLFRCLSVVRSDQPGAFEACLMAANRSRAVEARSFQPTAQRFGSAQAIGFK